MQLIAMGKLTGSAKQWYHSKIEYIQMGWTEIKEEMATTFDARPNKITLMKTMESRKWRKNEKFSAYYTDKVMLCNKVGLPDEDIIEYVIDGFSDSNLQSQARMKSFTSLNQLLTTMKSVTAEDRGSTSVFRPLQSPQFSSPEGTSGYRSTSTTPTVSQGQVRCYNCNQTGHRASACPKPRRPARSCFECGSQDHQLRECPRRRKPERGAADGATTHLVEKPVLTPACRTSINMKLT